MNTVDFKDRIKAIAGPAEPKAPAPIVRKPSDAGYFPPVRVCVMDCGALTQRGDILCEGCRSAVGRY